MALAQEFVQLPRNADTVYGFVAAVYPTGHPMLPEQRDHRFASDG